MPDDRSRTDRLQAKQREIERLLAFFGHAHRGAAPRSVATRGRSMIVGLVIGVLAVAALLVLLAGALGPLE